jgi:hypothetical protein
MQNMYSNLAPSSAQIRLALLLPSASFHDPIYCTFHVVSLAEQPQYKALSYVWGDKGDTVPIWLQDQEWPVTRNLAYALRQLRSFGVKSLWIDAICINQQDRDERTKQVGIMKDIYANASEVLVWLGPDPEESVALLTDSAGPVKLQQQTPGIIHSSEEAPISGAGTLLSATEAPLPLLAFNLLSHLAQGRHIHELPVFDVPQNGKPIYSHAGQRALRALTFIARNPWWQRIWAVQEIVLPENVRIVWANNWEHWSIIVRAAANFKTHQETCCSGVYASAGPDNFAIFELVQEISIIEHLRKVWRERGFSLMELLRYLGSRLATDPKDKIYALLSLATIWDETKTPRLVADYNVSDSIVYQHAAISTMLNTQSTNVLTLCSGERFSRNFPSWVPDWSTPPSHHTHLDAGV